MSKLFVSSKFLILWVIVNVNGKSAVVVCLIGYVSVIVFVNWFLLLNNGVV